MKKNKMMRLASVLLVAVLLSISAIGGTFAKFTDTYEGKATATVANWAFEMNDEAISNSFQFNLGDTLTEIGGGVEAEVDTEKHVIAPGTQGTFDIKLENLSDVTAAYAITIGGGVNNLPVNFTFGGHADAAGEGTIGFGQTATITVTWEWPWTEDSENSYKGLSDEYTITIVLEQVN